jgi:hypothetical protein
MMAFPFTSKSTVGSPPTPDLFIREDVAKPENRVNLALFSMMLVPAFRRWFLAKLHLDLEACVYPPRNRPGGRPDFVVVGRNGSVLAWIEVELGGENTAQLGAYRRNLSEPVKSVIGVPGYGGDLTLQEIAAAATDLSDVLDRQQVMNAGVLAQLVAELAHPPRAAQYRDPSDAIRQRPLMQQLEQRLPGILVFGIPPVERGTAQVACMSETGWTIRVYSTKASGGSVQVMNRPTNSIGVRIPSRNHLERYLPLGQAAVDKYVKLMLRLGIDISRLGPREQLPVDEEALVEHAGALAECLRELAMAYSGVLPNDL